MDWRRSCEKFHEYVIFREKYAVFGMTHEYHHFWSMAYSMGLKNFLYEMDDLFGQKPFDLLCIGFSVDYGPLSSYNTIGMVGLSCQKVWSGQ